MNTLKLLGILVVLLFGISLFQNFQKTRVKYNSSQKPTPTPQIDISLSPTPTPTVIKKQIQVIYPTNTPTPQSSSTEEGSYQYPGSVTVSAGVYKSTDDVGKITQWYKDKINGNGFSTTTVVQTTTNGVTYNKLVAAKNNERIDVEIKKNADSQEVTITVR